MIGEEVIAVYGDAGDGAELFEVQKLVRCRECKWWDKEVGFCTRVSMCMKANDFCSYGVHNSSEKPNNSEIPTGSEKPNNSND